VVLPVQSSARNRRKGRGPWLGLREEIWTWGVNSTSTCDERICKPSLQAFVWKQEKIQKVISHVLEQRLAGLTYDPVKSAQVQDPRIALPTIPQPLVKCACGMAISLTTMMVDDRAMGHLVCGMSVGG